MHSTQAEFCQRVRQRLPEHFTGKRVLDVGALDINGSNRGLFTDCDIVGVDLGPGKGVDRVMHAADMNGETFDVVISTEALEHDHRWRETIPKLAAMVRAGGLLVITCATEGRGEHGTAKRDPRSSPYTSDHYRNIREEELLDYLPLGEFKSFRTEIEPTHHDLYFWGVKS